MGIVALQPYKRLYRIVCRAYRKITVFSRAEVHIQRTAQGAVRVYILQKVFGQNRVSEVNPFGVVVPPSFHGW